MSQHLPASPRSSSKYLAMICCLQSEVYVQKYVSKFRRVELSLLKDMAASFHGWENLSPKQKSRMQEQLSPLRPPSWFLDYIQESGKIKVYNKPDFLLIYPYPKGVSATYYFDLTVKSHINILNAFTTFHSGMVLYCGYALFLQLKSLFNCCLVSTVYNFTQTIKITACYLC